MMRDRRKMRIFSAVLLAVLPVAAGILFACRGVLLRNVAERRISGMEKRTGLDIGYRSLRFDGFDGIVIEDLSAFPAGGDSLLGLRSLKADVDIWKLVRGKIDVERVELDGLRVNFLKKDGMSNYDFLFARPQETEEGGRVSRKIPETDYADEAEWLLDAMFALLPADAKLTDVEVCEQTDSNRVKLRVPELLVHDHRFENKVIFEEDGHVQHWKTEGEINSPERRLAFSVCAPDLTVPYIGRRFGAEVKFDTLRCRFVQEKRREEVRLSGQAEVSGLEVFHWRLSPEAVKLDRGALDFRVRVESDAFQLDSASAVRFNMLEFHPFLRMEKKGRKGVAGLSSWHFTASVRKPWFPAGELFGSLPKGLFGHLEGIQVEGSLAYSGYLDIDFSQLDSLKFDSRLESRDFRVSRFGKSDLRKMTGEFEYTAYEDGVPVRTFPVGPSWNHFLPLDSIPPMMQAAVLQSEDGAFFYHQGFLPDALREAMIYDLKKRRFARGGSTISMQLVKNVFLNRNKNLARKMEEALIVWLIETCHLTSKQRMYEVYLNIAEWGPMVYGIREAADFYFAKSPSRLSLEECIFLASIIPRPKHFMWSFTEEGRLKDSQEGHFRLVGQRMAAKGVITEAQAEGIDISRVVLKGEAGKFFHVAESVGR